MRRSKDSISRLFRTLLQNSTQTLEIWRKVNFFMSNSRHQLLNQNWDCANFNFLWIEGTINYYIFHILRFNLYTIAVNDADLFMLFFQFGRMHFSSPIFKLRFNNPSWFR